MGASAGNGSFLITGNGDRGAGVPPVAPSGWDATPGGWDAGSHETITIANGDHSPASWSREPFDTTVNPDPDPQDGQFRWLPDEEPESADAGSGSVTDAQIGQVGSDGASLAAQAGLDPAVTEWAPRWDDAGNPAEGTDFWSASAPPAETGLQRPVAGPPQGDESAYADSSWSAAVARTEAAEARPQTAARAETVSPARTEATSPARAEAVPPAWPEPAVSATPAVTPPAAGAAPPRTSAGPAGSSASPADTGLSPGSATFTRSSASSGSPVSAESFASRRAGRQPDRARRRREPRGRVADHPHHAAVAEGELAPRMVVAVEPHPVRIGGRARSGPDSRRRSSERRRARDFVLHRAEEVALGVAEIAEPADTLDVDLRRRRPARRPPRSRPWSRRCPRPRRWPRSPSIAAPGSSRAGPAAPCKALAGLVRLVVVGRSPGLEAPAEYGLVEGLGALDVVGVDGEMAKRGMRVTQLARPRLPVRRPVASTISRQIVAHAPSDAQRPHLAGGRQLLLSCQAGRRGRLPC